MNNIKVLKDNSKNIEVKEEKYIEPYPRKLICEGCQSELEYDESDLVMGEYGCMYVDCPICGEHNMLVDNEKSITLTVDNIEFPVHFHHVSVETGAKERCNTEEIRHELRRAITYFRKHKDEYYWYTSHGDLFLIVFRYSGDEEYFVMVTKDFYETYIPFEDEDYDENDNKSTRLRDAVDGLKDAIDGFGNMI